MGRKSRGGSGRRPVRTAQQSSDDDDDQPDPTSRNCVYDEVDEFHADRTDKILLEEAKRLASRPNDSDDEREEVYALSGDEDDDEDDDDNLAYFEALANVDREELASDLEEDHRDGLPSVKAWGTDKATFYDTDFVDNDRGYFKDTERRLAEAEEKEAMDMQKRMLEQLDNDDFGLDLLQRAAVLSRADGEVGTRVEIDVSVMSKQEKLEVVRRESPELLGLLEDFRDKLLEIQTVVQPLVDLANDGTLPRESPADYVHTKHQLLLNYCTNVCFYVMLKAKRTDTTDHPIVKRLVEYRKLLKALATIDTQMIDHIDAAMSRALGGKCSERSSKKRAVTKKVRIVEEEKDQEEMDSSDVPVVKAKAMDRWLTADERDALHLYASMRAGRRRRDRGDDDRKDEDERVSVEKDDREVGTAARSDGSADDVAGGKRRITSQIEKNKGLTPYRKKERRNPRVKLRNKFRKAKIRRKGQVQEVRRELKKYAGEVSGIRIGTSRSIRLG